MTTILIHDAMQFVSLNPAENKANVLKKATLTNWSSQRNKKSQIQQGMSPTEIADIVSDHLIEVVRKQFDAKRKELHEQAEQV